MCSAQYGCVYYYYYYLLFWIIKYDWKWTNLYPFIVLLFLCLSLFISLLPFRIWDEIVRELFEISSRNFLGISSDLNFNKNANYFFYRRIYEGRLISNAHSGISRKRDHIFKQTKVGNKVQYFSYKLTYLFFHIVALSFNTFFPT